ncbi:MAG TPA: LysE family transporter [Puia sp.]|jgi:threonine/homoserine/homoserine lactone efflux protein|nr:LysE family transporter [Puia sp.]
MTLQYFKLFFSALLISFLGSLPIGTLNVTVTSLTINKGILEAVEFASGAILVEVILVRVAVVALKKLEDLKYLYRFFSVLTCVILFSFAIIILHDAYKMRKFETALHFITQQPLLSGLFLSIINPLHLPFWIVWTAFLKSKKIFYDSNAYYNIYIVGIGLGTSLAFFVYGIFGNITIDLLKENQVALNWVIGFALLTTGLMQFHKTFIKEKVNNKERAKRKRQLEFKWKNLNNQFE